MVDISVEKRKVIVFIVIVRLAKYFTDCCIAVPVATTTQRVAMDAQGLHNTQA